MRSCRKAQGPPKAAGFPVSDGQPTYAYVSTNSFTGTNPIGITVYQVNAKDGSLAPVQAVADAFPSWVTVDPNRRFPPRLLRAVERNGTGRPV